MNRREALAGIGAIVCPDLLQAILNAWKALQKRTRAHLFISGVVQGVSYRASTQVEAQKRGVVGWVKNLDDGRVEAVLQGPRERVDDLIRWCHHGPPAAKVDQVVVSWENPGDDWKSFDVHY